MKGKTALFGAAVKNEQNNRYFGRGYRKAV